MQGSEALGTRGLDDRQPQRPAADPRPLVDRVDVNVCHRRRADDDDVIQPPQQARVVTGALRGDPQSGRHGRPDDLRGLGGVGRIRNRGRSLLDRDVPRGAGLVEAGAAGQVDGAAAQPAQRLRPGHGALPGRAMSWMVISGNLQVGVGGDNNTLDPTR